MSDLKPSPLRPDPVPEAELPVIGGLRLATAAAEVKYRGRDDVMLAHLAPGSVVAGVFTQSATRSAPVLDCQSKLGGDTSAGAAFLVNAGNSNAFTGKRGDGSVAALCAAVSDTLDLPETCVFTASTGVIGEPLPEGRIIEKLGALRDGLAQGGVWPAAEAIRTTDTFGKVAYARVDTDQGPVGIVGIAKGSGMIAPEMATMLAFVFTDAVVEQTALQAKLRAQVASTFNAVTVDSDTSTSDTLMLAATGASGVDCAARDDFDAALHGVLHDLALQVVRDGEGATKLVTVDVTGAADDADAKKAAMAIANSPLVKTAIAGEDPNWGRVVMAVGKSGAAADRDRLAIDFGCIEVAREGWVSANYDEATAAAYMKGQEIEIIVDLGIGEGRFRAYTCDLTHGYISINADYRS
jgi:glutamate N-acetyltransferase/amino-acid N-acetyltransferase